MPTEQKTTQTRAPFDVAKEISARVSLVVPSKVIKEEDLVEGTTQELARYILIWYLKEEQKEDLDIEKELERIVKQTEAKEKEHQFDVSTADRSSETGQITVTVSLKVKPHKANNPTTSYFSLVVEPTHRVFSVKSSDLGTTFDLTQSGEPLAEELFLLKGISSFPAAVGKLLKFVLADLALVGQVSTPKFTADDLDIQFFESLCQWFSNSPVVTPEAFEHLEHFVELLTKRKFTPDVKPEAGSE